jgi:regulator of sirC expression with transglutaminase-like and TPR domain
MPDIDYSADTEFSKLVARDSKIDLTIAALELARDADSSLDFAPTLGWIEQTANEIRPLIARTVSEHESLDVISQTIAIEYGIAGSQEAFEEAQGSFLNEVVRKKRGLPITLSVLYMAICERLSIDLQGVAAPMHFITRLESIEGPVFFDPYSGNRILTFDETVGWLSQITKWPATQVESCLEPASHREIITRMLMNLKSYYAMHENWAAAWIVLNRLSALSPSDYATGRDLAFIAGRANHTGTAVRLLKSLLTRCPEDERQAIEEELEVVEKQIHRWN